MILLHRLNGDEFALNPDLVERAEATPDTVLALTDGTRLVVAETVAQLIDEVIELRAEVLRRAWRRGGAESGEGALRLVTDPGS
ncbi:MAG: flagellar FlbD family protein [Acidimicrobiales bacterium]